MKVDQRLTGQIQRMLRQQPRWRVGTVIDNSTFATGTGGSIIVAFADGTHLAAVVGNPGLSSITNGTSVMVVRQGTDSVAFPLQAT